MSASRDSAQADTSAAAASTTSTQATRTTVAETSTTPTTSAAAATSTSQADFTTSTTAQQTTSAAATTSPTSASTSAASTSSTSSAQTSSSTVAQLTTSTDSAGGVLTLTHYTVVAPSASATVSSSSSDSDSGGANIGAIVGGIAGGIAGLVMLIWLVLLPLRRRQKRKQEIEWLTTGDGHGTGSTDGTTLMHGVGFEEDDEEVAGFLRGVRPAPTGAGGLDNEKLRGSNSLGHGYAENYQMEEVHGGGYPAGAYYDANPVAGGTAYPNLGALSYTQQQQQQQQEGHEAAGLSPALGSTGSHTVPTSPTLTAGTAAATVGGAGVSRAPSQSPSQQYHNNLNGVQPAQARHSTYSDDAYGGMIARPTSAAGSHGRAASPGPAQGLHSRPMTNPYPEQPQQQATDMPYNHPQHHYLQQQQHAHVLDNAKMMGSGYGSSPRLDAFPPAHTGVPEASYFPPQHEQQHQAPFTPLALPQDHDNSLGLSGQFLTPPEANTTDGDAAALSSVKEETVGGEGSPVEEMSPNARLRVVNASGSTTA